MMFGGDYFRLDKSETQEAIKFMYSLAQEYKALSLIVLVGQLVK